MKTRQDNNLTNCIREVYAKNETEQSWPTESGADCDENQRG